MTTANRDNIRQWLGQSDIDYFTYFVKAWIPFNAWYRNAYDTLHTERDILEEIKIDGNRIRSRFITKLEGGDPDSEEIRNHIAALHRRLSADPLQDRHGNRVSFENVCIGRNPQTVVNRRSYGWSYRVERVNARNIVSTVANRSSITICTISQNSGWNLEELESHQDYTRLDINKRGSLRQCYKEAHPLQFNSLLASTTSPRDVIEMDGYHFTNDRAAIFAGLVDILYAMRNLLFHGELVPDPQTNRTYEPAYHLVRHLINCIT